MNPPPTLADRLRRVPLTREGLFWFLVASAMLLTGLFKSINLITLLACVLVVLVGWNYWLARRQLRDVRARRPDGEPIFAGTPHQWAVQLINDGNRAAAGVRVQDGAADQARRWFVEQLPPHGSQVLSGTVVFPFRGEQPGRPLVLSCGYPVGLAHVTREAEPARPCVVLPRLGRLRRGVLRRLLSRQSPSSGQARGFPCPFPTAQAEFHGLRPYRPGDSPRHIHWRTSARRDELMVREFEDLPNDNLVLIVEAWRPAGDDIDAVLETTIRIAATICWEWCRQKGDRFVLVLAGRKPCRVSGVTGRPLAVEVLERLAVEPGAAELDVSAVLALLDEHELPRGAIAVVSSRGREFAGAVSQHLRRKVARLDVRAGEHDEVFED